MKIEARLPLQRLGDGVCHFTGLVYKLDLDTKPCASGHYLSLKWKLGGAYNLLIGRALMGPCISPTPILE